MDLLAPSSLILNAHLMRWVPTFHQGSQFNPLFALQYAAFFILPPFAAAFNIMFSTTRWKITVFILHYRQNTFFECTARFFFLWSFPDYIYSRGSRRSRCVSESNGNLKELSLLSTHLIGCLLLIDGSTYFFLKKSTAQPGQKLPHFLLCFLLSHSQ